MWLGYVFFVVYGSLVPLQYKARPLADAWAAFGRIPYLKLGIESRADWVANGVLYVPVGFLTVFLLASVFHRVWRPLLYFGAAVFCVALAVSVEFTQIFFPPRTVSLNDLIAECIGSVVGITACAYGGKWFAALLQSFLSDTRRLSVLGLDAYVVAYLAFALFPFDFLISAKELSAKLSSDNWGWLLAGKDPRWSLTLIKLAAEVVLTIPFGLLLARLSRRLGNHYALAVFSGLALGAGIEFAQFFIATGTSQGLSILTRAAGVWAGVALVRYLNRYAAHHSLDDLAAAVRRVGLLLAPVYGLLLLQVNGWFGGKWQGADDAQTQLARVNFMPFYYHYYTTEAIALFSLASVFMSYAPIGVLTWAMRWHPRWAILMALVVSFTVETGKLFIQGAHPDPTNALIAVAGAWVVASVLALFARDRSPARVMPLMASARDGAAEFLAAAPVSKEAQTTKHLGRTNQTGLSAQRSSVWARFAMAVCLAGVGVWLWKFPALQWLVAVVLIFSCITVWWRPAWAFAIIPAALPVFDLAPWSGRFFFDEFDALVLAVVSVAWVRVPPSHARSGRGRSGHASSIRDKTNESASAGMDVSVRSPPSSVARSSRAPNDPLFSVATGLLGAAFCIALLKGLWPFSVPDLNAFNNYFSHYNALRIFKGALWAWLLWRLGQRLLASGVDLRRHFAWGMTIGLGLAVAWIVWERVAFPGFLNFSDGYRVTGSFAATHTGGAYADCFIAAAMPFLIWLTFERTGWPGKILGLSLALLSAYALVVTFSRGGYLSFAVSVLVVSLALVLQSSGKKLLRNSIGLLLMTVAMGLVALPALRGDFFQSRLAQVQTDWAFRTSHWSDALKMRDPDLLTSVIGMGLGRFPETKYWRSELHPKVATYQLEHEKSDDVANVFLRLAPGDAIGVEQFVAVSAGEKYVLSFDARSAQPNAKVGIYICEKWLLTSADCVNPAITLGAQPDSWQRVELNIDLSKWPHSPPHTLRPVKLSLSHTTGKSAVDLDNLRLISLDNVNLLRNGDFAHGLDHWYFSIAGTLHAHWRTHNLFVQTLFDSGALGLVAMILFLGLSAYRSWKATRGGDLFAAAGLAAACGFVVGGMLDTQIDAPRMLMVLLLVAVAPRFHRKASDSAAPKQVA